jgi:hypothetical protein
MGQPNNILTGSGFGEIGKTTGNSRLIQFSLKADLLTLEYNPSKPSK